MCLLGGAATNIGAFHESLNLAALWRLPDDLESLVALRNHRHSRSVGDCQLPR
jgi:TPP-dependent pyruvate/acetoin dehydrogenase alpha subunit